MRFRSVTWLVVFVALAAICSCATGRTAADRATWDRLIATINRLQWSAIDQGAAFEQAQKELALGNYSAMQLGGPLFVARGDRTAVSVGSHSKPWHSLDQTLLCAGDLDGDGRMEYVMGCGWFGPIGGFICVYNDSLQKIVELPTDSAFAVELEDVTGDGRPEILCWQDEHRGTDGWRRYLTIFKLSKDNGLKPVWEGPSYTYSQSGGFDITKHRIRILKVPGKPAIIESKETDNRGTHEDVEAGTSYSYHGSDHEMARYAWDPVSEKFLVSK